MYKKFNSQFKNHVLTIFAGESYVSNSHEILSTVLGSCISVCLFDSEKNITGINHFMLPQPSSEKSNTEMKGENLVEQSMRYGMTAMEQLIAGMQKKGASRERLKAKVFGGGNVLQYSRGRATVGERNIGFVRAYLKSEKIEILGEDVGGSHGRKIFFLTENFSVFVKKVDLEPVEKEERAFMRQLQAMKRDEEDVVLF